MQARGHERMQRSGDLSGIRAEFGLVLLRRDRVTAGKERGQPVGLTDLEAKTQLDLRCRAGRAEVHRVLDGASQRGRRGGGCGTVPTELTIPTGWSRASSTYDSIWQRVTAAGFPSVAVAIRQRPGGRPVVSSSSRRGEKRQWSAKERLWTSDQPPSATRFPSCIS